MRQNISSSIVNTVVIVDFEAQRLKLSILLYVCFSLARSPKVDFDQEWAKIKRKYHLDDFSVRSDIIFPYGSLVCFRLRFEDFDPPFFSSEYCYAHFLFVCKLYSGVFGVMVDGVKRRLQLPFTEIQTKTAFGKL